jgi:hypothetical protein
MDALIGKTLQGGKYTLEISNKRPNKYDNKTSPNRRANIFYKRNKKCFNDTELE